MCTYSRLDVKETNKRTEDKYGGGAHKRSHVLYVNLFMFMLNVQFAYIYICICRNPPPRLTPNEQKTPSSQIQPTISLTKSFKHDRSNSTRHLPPILSSPKTTAVALI